jgi:hypothetical protein
VPKGVSGSSKGSKRRAKARVLRARAEGLAVSVFLEDEDLDWQEVIDRIDSMDHV